MRLALLWVSTLAWLALAVPTPAGASECLAFDAGNPPFMYEKNGAAAGFYPSLVLEAFHRMGLELRISVVPWKRALVGIDEARCGAAGLYRNEPRAARYDFSAPIHEDRLILYVPAGKDFPFKGLSDLAGKTVGVVRGWSYGDAFDAAVAAGVFAVEPAACDIHNFQKLIGRRLVESVDQSARDFCFESLALLNLSTRRLDAVLAVQESGEEAIRTLDAGRDIVALPTPLAVNDVHIAFHKSAGRRALLERFDQAVAGMRADGTYEHLARRHLGR